MGSFGNYRSPSGRLIKFRLGVQPEHIRLKPYSERVRVAEIGLETSRMHTAATSKRSGIYERVALFAKPNTGASRGIGFTIADVFAA